MATKPAISSIKFNQKSLAPTLKQMRKSFGYSQLAVANAIGQSVSSISFYENGLRSIPLDVLEKMIGIYGFELEISFTNKRCK